jgi:hypothetical protein
MEFCDTLLRWVWLLRGADGFDGNDLFPFESYERRKASINATMVYCPLRIARGEDDGASSATTFAASQFCASQPHGADVG